MRYSKNKVDFHYCSGRKEKKNIFSDYHNMAHSLPFWKEIQSEPFSTEQGNRTKITSVRAPVNRWITQEAMIRA